MSGQHQLEELARQEAYTNNQIFYICWDDTSILHLQMKDLVKDIKSVIQNQNIYSFNRREMAERYLQLSKIPTISEMFKKIKEKCKNDTLHIIIDEFVSECLDHNQADNLNAMFNTADWEPSCVLLLCQPLVREHTIISNSQEISIAVLSSYNRIDSMVPFTLSQHLRSTVSIYDFVKIATNTITSNVKNSIQHSENNRSNPAFEARNQPKEGLLQRLKRYVSIIFYSQRDRNSVAKSISQTYSPHNLNSDEESIHQTKSITNSKSDMEKDEPSFIAPIPLDELQVFGSSDNPNRTETRYSCITCNKVGHDIKGSKPKFIYFNSETTTTDNISKLFLILQSFVFHIKCDRLWFCKWREEFQLGRSILTLSHQNYTIYHPLSGYTLTDGDGNALEGIPQYYNLLTDNKGARGLEPRQAIVFIPSGNSKEQQSFLDVISRCTSELFIIYPYCFDVNDALLMPPVLHQLISEAICKDKIQECVAVGYEKDDTDDVVEQSFLDGKEYFYINHKSREYKKLNLLIEQLGPVDVSQNENYASP